METKKYSSYAQIERELENFERLRKKSIIKISLWFSKNERKHNTNDL
jgi:hypothetical protein